MAEKDVSAVERGPFSGSIDPWTGSPLEDLEKAQKFTAMPWKADGGQDVPSTYLPLDNSGLHARESSSGFPRLIPVPDSPPLSAQLLTSPSLSVQLPPAVPSFDKRSVPSQAPAADPGQYDRMRGQRRRRAYSRTDSKAGLQTRLTVAEAV